MTVDRKKATTFSINSILLTIIVISQIVKTCYYFKILSSPNYHLSTSLVYHFYIAAEAFIQGNKGLCSFNSFYLLQLIM